MYASDACRTVGNRRDTSLRRHGFTWENDLHLYYRRAKASEKLMLGDATFHRERIARLVLTALCPRQVSQNRAGTAAKTINSNSCRD